MGQNSKIEWTDHTFNPWRGCTKVSPGCANCYAEKLSKRNPKVLGLWGKNGSRVVAIDQTWRQPLRWNAEAEKASERRRVFCASLADVFEADATMPRSAIKAVNAARIRLVDLIARTPMLDWLLLTKRPENIPPTLARVAKGGSKSPGPGLALVEDWIAGTPPANVWLGTSVENQEAAEKRHQALREVPAVVHFWSAEPLIDEVDAVPLWEQHGKPDWVIIGGESGPKSRPCFLEWVRSLAAQCKTSQVACFVKQLGAKPQEYEGGCRPESPTAGCMSVPIQILRLRSKKGGDIEEWPKDLQVRTFPKVRKSS